MSDHERALEAGTVAMKIVIPVALLLILIVPLQVGAHHGPPDSAILYDVSEILEYEGEITEVLWRNPHIRFRLMILDDTGEHEIREMEIGPSPRSMRRAGVTEEILRVGARVRVAGFVSKRNPNSMGIVHVLLPNGEEITQRNREPRWSQESMVLRQSEAVDPAKVAAAERAADGIFRVWSSLNYPRPPVSSYTGYLTARGRQTAAAYDPVTDNPELECRTGMPATMFDPGQMLLEQRGDQIIVRIYEYDIERTIHLNGTANAAPTPTSNLGYSVGHWEGDTLVVMTTGLNSPYLDSYGTPQSAQVTLAERFTMTADGQRLNYAMTATDPLMFTEPVTLERAWRWTPEIEFEPFDCVMWTEPPG